MLQHLLAQFELHDDAVVATVVDRDDRYGQVMEGEGSSVHDAVADALHNARVRFASEHDERDACVAAMRSMRLSFELHEDGKLVSLGFV